MRARGGRDGGEAGGWRGVVGCRLVGEVGKWGTMDGCWLADPARGVCLAALIWLAALMALHVEEA
jgi:hypothetical protein